MGTAERGRRRFITTAGATLLVAATGRAAEPDEKVAPGEDLMREHGVLRRVILLRRLGRDSLRCPSATRLPDAARDAPSSRGHSGGHSDDQGPAPVARDRRLVQSRFLAYASGVADGFRDADGPVVHRLGGRRSSVGRWPSRWCAMVWLTLWHVVPGPLARSSESRNAQPIEFDRLRPVTTATPPRAGRPDECEAGFGMSLRRREPTLDVVLDWRIAWPD